MVYSITKLYVDTKKLLLSYFLAASRLNVFSPAKRCKKCQQSSSCFDTELVWKRFTQTLEALVSLTQLFFLAGENNVIQTQVAQSSCTVTPENVSGLWRRQTSAWFIKAEKQVSKEKPANQPGNKALTESCLTEEDMNLD